MSGTTQHALQQHLVRAVIAAQNDVAPELLDYIHGSTPAEIDASVEQAKRASAALVQRAMQGQVRPHDADDPGPGFAANVGEGISDQGVPDVSNWTLDEYAKHRDSLIRRRTGEGVGIFGALGS
jgi:hypothetical protein